ncbi:flavodoxin family protein [Catenibacterium mitsuokai]|uniref:flavodoxin family protein n=1 Tax=Catenibacterium mitsuokai TaxID=100886 RepID=UPI00319DBDC9
MVGIYLSGTGNTKHCVEKLVSMLEDTAKIVPLENTQITNILEQQDVIILGYPTQFSNAPFMVRDFIKRNAQLWRGKKSILFKYNGTFQW